jgi:hypothetical protein
MQRWLSPDMLVLYLPFLLLLFSAIVMYLWPRSRKAIYWCWGLAILAFIVSPGLSVLAWHLRHGSHVIMQGKRFRVPYGWTSSPSGTGFEIERRNLVLLPESIVSWSFGWIYIVPNQVRGAIISERVSTWRNVQRRLHREVDAPDWNVVIKNASGDIICVRTPPRSLDNFAMASCLYVEDGWTAEYMGRPSDMKTFFEILRTSDSP